MRHVSKGIGKSTEAIGYIKDKHIEWVLYSRDEAGDENNRKVLQEIQLASLSAIKLEPLLIRKLFGVPA